MVPSPAPISIRVWLSAVAWNGWLHSLFPCHYAIHRMLVGDAAGHAVEYLFLADLDFPVVKKGEKFP